MQSGKRAFNEGDLSEVVQTSTTYNAHRDGGRRSRSQSPYHPPRRLDADKNGLALHMQIRADMIQHAGRGGVGGGIPYWMERPGSPRRGDRTRCSARLLPNIECTSSQGMEGAGRAMTLPPEQSAHAEFPPRYFLARPKRRLLPRRRRRGVRCDRAGRAGVRPSRWT